MLEKIKNKLAEERGVDNTVETSANILVYVVAFLLVISGMNIMYREYKLHLFSSELIRTAELNGEVGAETRKRQEELEKTLGIKPTVVWDRTGKYNLNETISLTLTLGTDVKFPLFRSYLTLTKKATGTSEVYHK